MLRSPVRVATRYAGLDTFTRRRAAVVPFRLFAATGDAVARLDSPDGASVQTTIVLGNEHQARDGAIVNGVMCVASLTEARQTASLERAMADLPSGTVTFLFTDIESSTALWE